MQPIEINATVSPVESSLSLGFAFWNTNKRPIANLIRQLADENDVDVIILAENAIDPAHLLDSLNENQQRTYLLDAIPSPKITLLSRLPQNSIKPISDDLGICIRHVAPPVGDSLLLVGAHFPSKLHRDEIGHLGFTTRVATMIKEAEERVGHCRTLLVGDLNMNPFEPGIIAANGLHAIMSRRIAERHSRYVDGVSYPFFYNPMWGRFGDSTQGPPGTYHYGPTGYNSHFWNIFDQILLRPSLLPFFNDDQLQIISQIGTVKLIDEDDIPDPSIASDHLPVVFRLNVNN
jgi:vacuolar-type H+-ATPase subunit F/Vma7